ncbi:carbohydrate ABC transporter permease [Clostridium sp. YIM B02505]|uniref:Carbohydrate ABC transporter permease n=1 Tax=Clostridium yunnanense TaxID=2800325 RepID=A0ABS1EJT9_9CLOT|nr:carbohydrate ABC transporter permease [Clostridium yunnanense]MBK1809629.1 carbohydrate ABC transporter permease [Clostridium yunnanense]
MLKSKISNKSYGAITTFDLKRKPVKTAYMIMIVICFVIVIASIVPPLWVMLSSFKSQEEFFRQPPTFWPDKFHPERLADTWNKLDFIKYYKNSLISVVGSVVCAIVFNGLLAYVIAIIKPRGSKVIHALVMISLMIPATTSLVPVFKNIVALHLNNQITPLWFVAGANAFYVILYITFFKSIPTSLIEAARLDGCSDFQIFFKIVAPLSKAINMVIGMYAVNAAWSDFLLPYLVLKKDSSFTVMVKLFVARQGGKMTPDQLMMCITLAIIPPIILFILFQKQITAGAMEGSIKE